MTNHEFGGARDTEGESKTHSFRLTQIEQAARPVDVPIDMKFVTLEIGNRGVAGFMTPENLTNQQTRQSQISNVRIESRKDMTRRADMPDRYKPCLIIFDRVEDKKTEGFLVYLEQHHIEDLEDNFNKIV